MTDKTRVVAIRLPNEVADWLERTGSPRALIEGGYEDGGLDLSGVKRACDRKRIDYQLALNRMEQLINED